LRTRFAAPASAFIAVGARWEKRLTFVLPIGTCKESAIRNRNGVAREAVEAEGLGYEEGQLYSRYPLGNLVPS